MAAIRFGIFAASALMYFAITAYVAVRGARDTRDLLQPGHHAADPGGPPPSD